MSTIGRVNEALSPELVLPQIRQWHSLALLRLAAHIGWWLLCRMVLNLRLWHERSRQRRRLMTLDSRLLKDIGLTHADVQRESGKPFWRA